MLKNYFNQQQYKIIYKTKMLALQSML